MLKAVIFDFDYTLGDSGNGIALSINYALERLGYEVQKLDAIRKTIGLSLKETFFALTSGEDENEAEQFARLFKQKADVVMVENTELYAGVKEVLRNLRENGYKTAIVTTKFHYRIEQILEKFDALELIDFIVGAEDVKIEKPNPEGLLWTIEQMGLQTDEVLYVGDSLVDAKTAQNAKVDFAAVLTGTTTRREFEKYANVFIGANVEAVYQYILYLEQVLGRVGSLL